ncbi:MAG: hypothetical protein WAM85_11905 [Terracidiphilus sp.]
MFDIVTTLISQRKIPALDELQMEALLHHLFTTTPRDTRIQVAEVAYRFDHDHPRAMDVFLSAALPLAERSARRRAAKVFVHPSDLQIELMYGGAVEAVLEVFQTKRTLKPDDDAFRRYLLRAMVRGALRAYFRRDENDGVRAEADLTVFANATGPFRNGIEDEIITWELLDQVMAFPQLRPPVRATLECIRSLGPDHALKQHAFTTSGDPDAWKRERCRRPILDPKVIAQAMGLRKAKVHQYLREARLILRQAFNQDGKLFLTR